jgi:hypothetical protein
MLCIIAQNPKKITELYWATSLEDGKMLLIRDGSLILKFY